MAVDASNMNELLQVASSLLDLSSGSAINNLQSSGKNEYHKCESCELRFSTKRELEVHWSVHNKTKERIDDSKDLFRCHFCGRDFASSNHLQSHLRVHTVGKAFLCEVCDKCFTNSAALKFHFKKIHSGVKPYKCEVCGQQFTQSDQLQTHKSSHSHSGEKPYTSEIIVNHNTKISCLETSTLTPVRDNPYTCQVCGKSFADLNLLHDHVRLHNNPYTCQVCDKAFTDLNLLHDHVRIHNGERPFRCADCGKCFFYLSTLKVHSKIHVKPINQPKQLANCC